MNSYRRVGVFVVAGLCILAVAILWHRHTTPSAPSFVPPETQPETIREKPSGESSVAGPIPAIRDGQRGQAAVIPDSEVPFRQSAGAAAAAPVVAAGNDSGSTVLTLNPEPVDEPIEPYRERFASANIMEIVRIPKLSDARSVRDGTFLIHRLRLPVPGGRLLDVDLTKHDRIAPRRGVFIGRVEGHPISEVIVSYHEEAITASMIIPGIGHYEIAYAGNGNHLLLEIDPARIMPSAQPVLPPPGAYDSEAELP